MIVSQKIVYYHAIIYFLSLVYFFVQSFILFLSNDFFFSFKLSFSLDCSIFSSFPLFQFFQILFFSFLSIACVWSAFVPCTMLMPSYTTIYMSRVLTRYKSDFLHLPFRHEIQTLQLVSGLSFRGSQSFHFPFRVKFKRFNWRSELILLGIVQLSKQPNAGSFLLSLSFFFYIFHLLSSLFQIVLTYTL